jgi:hypothetical protein
MIFLSKGLSKVPVSVVSKVKKLVRMKNWLFCLFKEVTTCPYRLEKNLSTDEITDYETVEFVKMVIVPFAQTVGSTLTY